MLDPSAVPSESTLERCCLETGYEGDINPVLSIADSTKLGILVNRSAVLCLQNKFEEAEGILYEARKICKPHLSLKHNLLYILLRGGKTTEAVELLTTEN